MKVLAVLGTLGSGKTTLINQTLPRFKNLRVLVVVNDVGTVNIDARRIEHVGEVKALTAGCIGCGDLPAFKQIIAEAESSGDIDLLIIEPTGIADGREIKEAVEGSGIACHCLTLMDAKHFNRNRALNTLPTQLAVADVILITWVPSGKEASIPVMEYIADHASGTLVEQSISITDADGLGDLASRILSTEPRDVSSEPIGGYDHEHKHGHNHGVYPYSVTLKSECAFEDIVLAIAPFRGSLLRAKGVVAGKEFDFVQGDLLLGKPSAEYAHANFITSSPLPATVFRNIEVVAAPDTRTKKERMRSDDGIPLEDTLDAIRWQLEQYPPVVGDHLLRVDYEADVAYQLAHRPGVPKEYWRMALQRYFGWRVKAGAEIRSGRWDNHPNLPYWKRRVGMNLAWHALTYPDDLSRESVRTAINLYPANMALEGLQKLETLSFAEEMAEERPEIIKQVIAFGRVHETLTNVRGALWHCLELSASNPDWEARWKKTIAELGY